MTFQRPFVLTNKRLLAAFVVLAVVLAGVWFAIHSRTQSNTVASQLRSLDPDKLALGLANITTNEIPVLLEMLQTEDSEMKKKLVSWVREADRIRLGKHAPAWHGS